MNPNNLVRDIHIGNIISQIMAEKNLSINTVRHNMGCSRNKIIDMLNSSSLDTAILLKWSKVLRYDFFRLFSSHLMLHHGISNTIIKKKEKVNVEGINIRKNVYTKEMINFLVSKVRNNEMKPMDIVNEYGIPKTTMYKWLQKYPNQADEK